MLAHRPGSVNRGGCFATPAAWGILDVMYPYDYADTPADFSLEVTQRRPHWERYRVEFRPAAPTRYESAGRAYGQYFRPKAAGQPAPLVVMLHGVGDASTVPCRWLARHLAGHGIASFVLYLPLHSSRLPDGSGRSVPRWGDDEWFECYRSSVVEVRQVLDWAATRPELDAGHLGVFGISFGGFVAAIAMGVDRRLRAGVLVVSGGNSGRIVWEARARVVRGSFRMDRREYQEGQAVYAAYLSEVVRRGVERVEPPRRSYLNDPMTFAHLLRGRPLLMLNARWDEFVPRRAVLDFWEAAGRPELVWLPTTHASIWLLYPRIRRVVTGFLRRSLGPAGVPPSAGVAKQPPRPV